MNVFPAPLNAKITIKNSNFYLLKSPIDYEKCVYYVTGGFTTHSDAELQCEAQIASKCNILDCQVKV